MTGKTHQAIGLAAASAVFFATQPATPLTWPIAGTIVVGAFIGSLLPDIDQPTSNFWQSIPLGGLGRAIVPKTLGGHRNLSHSILGVLLFYGVSSVIAKYVLAAHIDQSILLQSLLAGFLAHLAADTITVRGIPLFWPFGQSCGFPPYPFQGARIVTGKWFENLVVLPVALLVLGYVLLLNH